MAFSRDRFQAAKLEVNKKVTDEVEKTFKSTSSRGDYHSIEEGVNVFRMMPPHEQDEPSMQAKVIYWLDCRVEEMKDDKPTGKYVVKPRPIFDSRIHGGTPKDIIDEYIQFTKKKIFENVQDKDEKAKLLAPINGWRDKTGKWNPGILASQSFVCYATKGDIIPENLGRLELWKRDKEELERLNILEAADEPIVTDKFSDPNSGLKFIITKGRDSKGVMFTKIDRDHFVVKGNKYSPHLYEEWLKSQIVPDNVLEKFSEMEPLSKQFKNTYKKSDFERAVEALEMFDTKHGYGTFEDQDWLSIVKEISGYYVDQVEQVEGSIPTNITPTDINDMTRAELKKYIKERGLSITVVPSMSEDVIREMIWEAEGSAGESEDEVEPEGEGEVDAIGPPTESLKERLARLRKN